MDTSVGSYQFEKEAVVLGHGAFAIVYRGCEILNKAQKVAIKVINKKTVPASLSKEIAILENLKTLKHENLVSLLDYKDTDAYIYLVTEFCNGGDLDNYLFNHGGMLNEMGIARLARQIGSAMKVLHSRNIVHRDLKPANILLIYPPSPNPPIGDITFKIADFGFARFLKEGKMAATLCGSPLYMAPEVHTRGAYDGKADLWSIGAIFFQCLTGEAPFIKKTYEELSNFYQKTNKLKPNIPNNTDVYLKDLLLGLLVKEPKDRLNFDMFFNHNFLRVQVENNMNSKKNRPKDLNRNKIFTPTTVTNKENSLSPPQAIPSRTRLKEKENRTRGSPQVVPTIDLPPKNGGTLASFKDDVPFFDDFEFISEDDLRQVGQEMSSLPPTPNTRRTSLPMYKCVDPATMHRPYNLLKNVGAPFEGHVALSKGGSSFIDSARAFTFNMSNRTNSCSALPSIDMITPPISQVGSYSSVIMYSHRNSPSSPTEMISNYAVTPTKSPQSESSFPSMLMNAVLPASGCFITELDSFSTSAPPASQKMLISKDNADLTNRLRFIFDLSLCIRDLAQLRDSMTFSDPNDSPQSVFDDRKGADKFSFDAEGVLVGGKECNDTNMMLTSYNGAWNGEDKADKHLEQAVLYARTMHLLSSAIEYARKKIDEGSVTNNNILKNLLREMNNCYQECKVASRNLKKDQMVKATDAQTPNVEKILYVSAINACRIAAEEFINVPDECYKQYCMAYNLLHWLDLNPNGIENKNDIKKYKEVIEKRLILLQNKGYVYIDN